MVKLTVLSAIFFTVGVLPTALARPQDVGASATTVPGSASTATPDAKTEENNRDFVPGVEAVVNTYTLDGVLQEVHLMKPGICYFLPDSVGKLTYKVAGPKLVRAYNGTGDFCDCTGEASPTIFQVEDRMDDIPAPWWCMNIS